MIHTLLFDLGNVLVHFSHDQMCQQVADLYQLSSQDVRQKLFVSGLEDRFERGEFSEEEFHQAWEFACSKTADYSEFILAISNIFSLNSEMSALVKQLKHQKFRLVLISNTTISHFQFIQQQWDVLSFFDEYVLSYEVHAMKPEKEIYQAALQKIACRPDEALFTDDIKENVEHARLCGLNAEQFTNCTNFKSELSRYGIVVE